MKLTWPAVYAVLFIYRSIASVFAVGVIVRLTTLGDSHAYATLELEQWIEKSGFGLNSNVITFLYGLAIRKLFFANEFIVSMAYQVISFVGIVMLLMSLEPKFRLRIVPLFFFPSFTVWTSIAGKETFVVFFVCLILKAVTDFAYRGRFSFVQVGIAFVGIVVFKPQFLPGTMYLFGLILIVAPFRIKASLVAGAFMVTVSILFALRPFLEIFGPELFLAHFMGDNARTNRPPFWTEEGDLFAKAAEGMWLAFVGPTLEEIKISVVHLFSYVESMILLTIFLAHLLRDLPRIPLFCFLLGLGTIFWTLAPNYGAGVMNPGTAVRYRSDWIPVLYFCFTVLMTRDFGLALVERFRMRKMASVDAPAVALSPARPT
jgi:hypothetical protein